jgi:hypothetical protein
MTRLNEPSTPTPEATPHADPVPSDDAKEETTLDTTTMTDRETTIPWLARAARTTTRKESAHEAP